jgi:hypothetical protein
LPAKWKIVFLKPISLPFEANKINDSELCRELASEIQDFLLVDKYKTQTGEKLTDFDKAILDLKRPENHEKKVKIALLFKLLEKDPSLSTIQKAGVTKKSEALFGELARQKKTSVSSAKKEKESPSWWANNE